MKPKMQNRIKGLALRLFCVFGFFEEKRGFYGRANIANIRTIDNVGRGLSVWLQCFSFRRFVFYWLVLFPFLAFCDFSEVDAGRLQHIHDDISEIEINVAALESILRYDFKSMVNTVDRLEDEFLTAFGTNFVEAYPRGYLYAFMNKFSNSVSYDTDSIFGRLNLNFETYGQNLFNNQRDIVRKLDSIISLLTESGSGGSGGSGDTEINQNWLTEAKYTELANQFLSSWGFEGGSSGTFRDYFLTMVGSGVLAPAQARKLTRYMWEYVPFPQNMPSSGLPPFWLGFEETTLTTNPSHIGHFGVMNWYLQNLNDNLVEFAEVSLHNKIKESWNDWQAHTNLVENILLSNFMPTDSPNPENIGSIDDSRGVLSLTFDKGTGDSPDEINLTPSFTNDTNTLYENLGNVTNRFEKLVVAEDIKNRYFRNYISEEQKHIDVVQMDKLNDKIDFFTYEGKTYSLEMSDNALSMYREIFSYDVLRNIRGFVYSFYVLLVGISCFWLFLKVGKI